MNAIISGQQKYPDLRLHSTQCPSHQQSAPIGLRGRTIGVMPLRTDCGSSRRGRVGILHLVVPFTRSIVISAVMDRSWGRHRAAGDRHRSGRCIKGSLSSADPTGMHKPTIKSTVTFPTACRRTIESDVCTIRWGHLTNEAKSPSARDPSPAEPERWDLPMSRC